MKKSLIVLMIICITIFLFSCSNNVAEIPDVQSDPTEPTQTLEPRTDVNFRNVKWGDNRNTVMLYETASFTSDEEQTDSSNLFYNDSLAGLSTIVAYAFDSNDRLYKAVYLFQDEYTVTQYYIVDYNNLKQILVEKYGEPYRDAIVPLENAVDNTDDATALELGYTLWGTQWKTNDTEISLIMMAENNKVEINITYSSIEIKPEIDTSGF